MNELLPPIICPECNKEVHAINGRLKKASDFKSCLRRCEPCGIGFSNANSANPNSLTKIYRNPIRTLPVEIAKGHEAILARALNILNRPSKAQRFAFSTSEDHVTWTIFRAFQLSGNLCEALNRVGCNISNASTEKPTMLLWGSPVPTGDDQGEKIREKLLRISDLLGERIDRRSEPDVILDFQERGVVFIEVKLKSKNDFKPKDYPNWSRYVGSSAVFQSDNGVKNTGMYELARNWRLAWELSSNRPFSVINLGPRSLFEGKNADALNAFSVSLKQSAQQNFITAAWEDFLGDTQKLPDWLKDYVNERL